MRTALRRLGIALVVLLVVAVVAVGLFRRSIERFLVVQLEAPYEVPPGALEPTFDGADADRKQLTLALVEVAADLEQLTDIQFVPGEPSKMVVALKAGDAVWVDVDSGGRGLLAHFDVLTPSEQGLLGIAFHPRFPQVPRVFTNSVELVDGADRTRIRRCELPGGKVVDGALNVASCDVLLEVEQPYQNHNAGQLAFGPDGMLYIGMGDGGLKDDPQGNGQDRTTLLGSMLRLDVDTAAGQPYAVPNDNPFADGKVGRAEIWATGLRNPWRYSFAPDGRLIVADVGQNRFEEITVLGRGQNAGWSEREGATCFPPDSVCNVGGMVEPIYVYGRQEGLSVTGGYVVMDDSLPALHGKYVFGDFVTGRMWAIDVPPDNSRVTDAVALGKWPMLISTFGRDSQGRLYVGDYGNGVVHRVVRGRTPAVTPSE